MKFHQLPVFAILVFTVLSCSENGSANKPAEAGELTRIKTSLDSLLKKEEIESNNKKIVADMYQQLFGDKDTSVVDRYIGATYINHNPGVPDGPDALKKVAAQWFAGQSKEKIDIRHLSAEGDLVYIHTKGKYGPKVVSVIDIFRLENGKIVEHWDLAQEVPAKAANDHPMF